MFSAIVNVAQHSELLVESCSGEIELRGRQTAQIGELVTSGHCPEVRVESE